jgi:hypothetical protein
MSQIVGIGRGKTALVMAAIVSTRWFTERRGLVLGMLTASSATGQLALYRSYRSPHGSRAITAGDGRSRHR